MSNGERGLTRFSFHRDESEQHATITRSLAPPIEYMHLRGASADPALLDPETAARNYLDKAFGSSDLPGLVAAEMAGEQPEFTSLGVRRIPITDTQLVKFRQQYRGIPVYSSFVTVELDTGNELLAINSTLGEPDEVDPVAKLSPDEALKTVRQAAGYRSEPLEATPKLYYYHEAKVNRWRLVYITEDVMLLGPPDESPEIGLPQLYDFVVDAHSGELVAQLPRTQTAVGPSAAGTKGDGFSQDEYADDLLGNRRRLGIQHDPALGARLADLGRNLHTHDFQFQDIRINRHSLPGPYVARDPTSGWDPAAVSAHANAAEVADYLRDTLQRDGIDDEGGPYVSSVNCVYGVTTREWRNAAWVGTQMVYGQRLVDGKLRSYSVADDVVAHEIFHGVTSRTSRLEYRGETGALNESYSDIFGILIANRAKSSIDHWDWEMGEDLDQTGIPLRDMSDPTRSRYPQPAHMRDYRSLPETREGDWGGVHSNSGIHNKAAYNLLTSRDSSGGYVFRPHEVAHLFYLTLTQYLTRTSGFVDSLRGAIQVARSLFRNDSLKDAKLAAITRAFLDIGVGLDGPITSATQRVATVTRTNLPSGRTMTSASLEMATADVAPTGFIPFGFEAQAEGVDPVDIPKTTDELGELKSLTYELTVRRAGKLNIPVVGNLGGSYNRRVVVQEWAVYKPVFDSAEIEYHYGYVIRFCLTVNNWDAKSKISLPFLSAQAELGTIQASWLMQVRGLAGPKINEVVLPPQKLDVQTFVIAQQSLEAAISAVKDPQTKFISGTLLAKIDPTDQDAKYWHSAVKTYALDSVRRGRNRVEAQQRLGSDDRTAMDLVSETYTYLGVDDPSRKPGDGSRNEARRILHGIEADT